MVTFPLPLWNLYSLSLILFSWVFVNNCFCYFPLYLIFFSSSKTIFLDILGLRICFLLKRFFSPFHPPILFSLAPGFCNSYSFVILSQPSREGAGAYIPLAFQMLTRVFWRMSDWQTNTSSKYSECSVTNSFILVNTVSKITLERDRPYF